MSLEQEIAAWDGKSAADIKAVYDACHTQPAFAEMIVELVVKREHEKGATWLLKAWLEAGNKLKRTQVKVIYNQFGKLEHWEAKLHVLQSMPFMPIDEADREKVYSFLKATLTDPNKFVRAWSYNGFYELSRQHSQYLSETKHFFEMAMGDEAPSVKARIRNILKKGF